MQPLITICARKGSKGLPGKNIREFNGRPLIEWTIEAAVEWGAGPIVISSDDEVVQEIFSDYVHCDIYFDERPEHLAQDTTPKLDVLRYVAEKTQVTMGNFDYLVDLDPTNPCRTVADLDICRKLFEEEWPKTLISVTNARKNPFFNQIRRFKDTVATVAHSGTIITSRQETDPLFDVNAAIYFYDMDWLLSESRHSPITNFTKMYVMEDHAFCDIDSEIDFKVAEFLHREYYT